jgi:nanoRNase/pAp phosphatase (c-di-AMP/oligoRNAs hydrolase)
VVHAPGSDSPALQQARSQHALRAHRHEAAILVRIQRAARVQVKVTHEVTRVKTAAWPQARLLLMLCCMLLQVEVVAAAA